MRIVSSLVTFIFLGVTAAGVVPGGGKSASMSGVQPHPSGGHSYQSASHPAPSGHPTGSGSAWALNAVPSHYSGSPSGASGHLTRSAAGHAYSGTPSNVVGSHKPSSPSDVSIHFTSTMTYA
ncbi:hypothetical protein J3R83DRAFT_7879 [Lanmaoa asiatica]|nr:hypothetical protein J3R83DRAFT_7879 [Lanmaoa asiatica]